MAENTKPDIDPTNSVPLESILCTEELQRRPSRPPDYKKESRALVALAEALSDSPRTVLQTLAETILEVCRAGSAGVSLLTKDDGGKRFYWPAIAGQWKQHIGGGTPRDFGPCGDVLDRNASLLMRQVHLRYKYFEPVQPGVEEALLVPFYVQGKAVGTIWSVAHDDRRFDLEDERVMESLGKFASSAYQILEALHEATMQAAEAKKGERACGLCASIVDSSDDAIVGKTLDGVIISWNRAAERLFGYGADEAIGQPITLIIPLDRRDEETRIIESIKRGERIDHFETIRQRKDGTLLDISLTISPLRDSAGTIVGASKIARDIGSRIRAKRSLAEQARLLDLSADAIIVRDADDRIAYWNRGATEIYGYSREEAVGRISHELFQTTFPEPLEKIGQTLKRDGRWTGQLSHKLKNGREIVVSSRWALDTDLMGNPLATLETNNDITAQKRYERMLRETKEQLRALNDGLESEVRLRTQELERKNAEVVDLSMRLMHTQDEERRHIARELHDTSGQTMTVLGMKIDRLLQKMKQTAPELAADQMAIQASSKS